MKPDELCIPNQCCADSNFGNIYEKEAHAMEHLYFLRCKELDDAEKKLLIAIDTLSGIACNQFEYPCDQADFALKRINER